MMKNPWHIPKKPEMTYEYKPRDRIRGGSCGVIWLLLHAAVLGGWRLKTVTYTDARGLAGYFYESKAMGKGKEDIVVREIDNGTLGHREEAEEKETVTLGSLEYLLIMRNWGFPGRIHLYAGWVSINILGRARFIPLVDVTLYMLDAL
jgi:hypothetical protein